jgi:hypothetical protein
MTLTAFVLSAVLSVPAVAIPQAADVAGKWDVSVQTDQGERPGVLTITQSADKLAATISGPQGEAPADISLKGNAITVSFSMQGQNGAINITMSGTVEGNTMQGTVDIGGVGTAPWTARRAAAQDAKPPQSQDKPAPTMTGTWAIEAHHAAGTSTPTATITQTGEKLTGKYIGSYGEAVLTGSIKGQQFTFTVEIGTEQKVEVVYTGTLEGDTIKGTLTMGEMGEGTFTGKRK